VVRRNEGGGLVPRPGMGFVQASDRAEKRTTTRLRQKSSLEVSPGMVTTACGFILQDKWCEKGRGMKQAFMRESTYRRTARSTIRR
jgi:hypothetical protein